MTHFCKAKKREENYRKNHVKIENRTRTYVLANDFKTAFDRVNRAKLLEKMDKLNFSRDVLMTI